MKLDLSPLPLPLAYDADGNVRVGGTRVTLDTIVACYKQYDSPEEIAYGFPTVGLANIYAAFAYYLSHKAEVDEYLERQEREAEEIRRKIEALHGPQPTLEQLLARRAERERAEGGRVP